MGVPIMEFTQLEGTRARKVSHVATGHIIRAHKARARVRSATGVTLRTTFSAAALLQDLESHDAVLAAALQRLAALEADPETDELTLVAARHEVLMRKMRIAAQLDRG